MSQRIVAIDDSDIAQEFIRAALNDIGFEDVTGFLDPREALRAVKSGGVMADLILLDIMMPDIDGIELCARIREVDGWSDVPIIMLSSRKEMDTLSQAFMAGANDYVTKPFSRIELQARMRSCLRLKSELDRRRRGDRDDRDSRQAANAESSTMPGIFGGKAGFQAALMALSHDAGRAVGLIVCKMVLEGGHQGGDDRARGGMPAQIGAVLGEVQICARESFAHWQDDIFCLAVPDATAPHLEQRAQQFVGAVEAARLRVKDGWTKIPVGITACVVLPGASTPAHALARGIKAAEKASLSGRFGVVILDKNGAADA